MQVVGVALVHLARSGYEYSLQFEAGGPWDGYAPGLRQGWLLGRRVDLSDAQWRELRSALPALSALFALFALLSRAARRLPPASLSGGGARAALHVAVAAAFLCYLHGLCAAHVFALVAANYVVAQAAAGRRHGAAAIWAFNVGALLAARLLDGLPFALLLGPRGAWLDSHRGVVRWHICFNLTVLRMLSYGMDLHWARLAQRARPAPTAPHRPPPPATPRQRQDAPLPSSRDYGLLYCLAHALYPPLYLAGPIVTFQDFAWQLRRPEAGGPSAVRSAVGGGVAARGGRAGDRSDSSRQPSGCGAPQGACHGAGGAGGAESSTSPRAVLRYASRLGADLLCLELLTHLLYFNSLAVHRVGLRYRQYGLRYGAAEVGLTGWWVLAFMWLKFAATWRFFRLAALAEGLDAPENMQRCFANNYEVEGFWRGWHASYNRWLVRYIYVPLGGSRRRALTIWPVFLFVAAWHDLEWRLLSWAWLVCLAFLPEMAAKRFAAGRRFDSVRGAPAFRAACAAAAALNIAALMAANMVGFVVGPAGAGELLAQLAASPGYAAAALGCFYCAAQVMFELRAQEAAAGSNPQPVGAEEALEPAK